MLIRKLVNQ